MKGAFFALQKSHYCIAKGVLLKSKRGSFAAKTNVFASRNIAYFEWNSCKVLISRQLWKATQNSRIPHQIFPCAFNSQFWAVENANIVWSFTLKLWCWGGVICSTSYRRLWGLAVVWAFGRYIFFVFYTVTCLDYGQDAITSCFLDFNKTIVSFHISDEPNNMVLDDTILIAQRSHHLKSIRKPRNNEFLWCIHI